MLLQAKVHLPYRKKKSHRFIQLAFMIILTFSETASSIVIKETQKEKIKTVELYETLTMMTETVFHTQIQFDRFFYIIDTIKILNNGFLEFFTEYCKHNNFLFSIFWNIFRNNGISQEQFKLIMKKDFDNGKSIFKMTQPDVLIENYKIVIELTNTIKENTSNKKNLIR